jgi:transcriptional regulator with XRE-family HTH domain
MTHHDPNDVLVPSDTDRRMLIATRVREARRLAGLSQSQVAKLLDLHRPAVSEIEAGNRRVTASEIGRLAELFDVAPSWLMGHGEETVDVHDTRIQLAARELSKLAPDDVSRLLKILASMRGGDR